MGLGGVGRARQSDSRNDETRGLKRKKTGILYRYISSVAALRDVLTSGLYIRC